MMRWMLGILLVANVSLFIWGRTVAHRGQPPVDVPLVDIGVIELAANVEEPVAAMPDTVAVPVVVAIEEQVESEPARASARANICAEIVSVTDESQAKAIQSALTSAGFQVILANKERVEEAGYWALIPVAKNIRIALETEAKLKAAGIDDIWRFRKGSLKHAISLGMYDRENSAKKRAAFVASKGFETATEPKTKRITDYRIGFSGGVLKDATVRVKKVVAEVDIKEISCAEDFPF